MRNFVAVLCGYAVFVVGAVVMYQWTGMDPHADPTGVMVSQTLVVGLLSSFAGGYLTQIMAGSGRLTVNYALAAVLAGFALFSLFKSTGNHYSQWMAMAVFAPVSFFGGVIRLKKRKKQ